MAEVKQAQCEKCGNVQQVEMKPGLCIPFVKCSKCGALINTSSLCH